MTASATTSETATSYEGHELVKVCDSPFSSLPLFLPADAKYNPETNTVIKHQQDDTTNGGPTTAAADKDSDSSTLHNLVKVPNAGWDMLQALEVPISVISCIGPYRTGKSLLVSRFLNTSNAFQIGPTLEGCTVGIWISTTALKDPKTGCYKFVLDVEGLGDPLAGDEASNARMALTCLLLSSVVLFNNTSHPDRGSLQFLKCLSTIRRRIQTNNNNNGNSQRHCFPSFIWIFRDFFLQLPPRRDTGKPYTLQEFMMERVLKPTSSTAASGDKVETEVVDSLLNDFESLQVLSASHPKRQGQHPLSPEEMAHLDTLDWQELDESFRNDIHQIIITTLNLAKPFELGQNGSPKTNSHAQKKGWNIFSRKSDQYAWGKAYAKWCETVLELVNSTGVIPNLPDLQQQLVQQMADAQLAQCVTTFQTELETYWNSCPIYSGDKALSSDLVTTHSLQPVAEESELKDRAQKLFAEETQKLSKNITSSKVLHAAIEDLETRCLADEETNNNSASTAASAVPSVSSIYARVRLANSRRSQSACESLMNSLYTPVQESIRNDPTSMTVQEFRTVVGQLQASYEKQARGPAKQTVLSTLLLQPSEADALFVAKMTESNEALQHSLSQLASLSHDIEEKEAQLTTLHTNLEQVKEQNQRELEALSMAHKTDMQQALEAQQQREQEQREQLQADMEKQLQQARLKAEKERQESEEQLKRVEQEAQKRLQSEVQAREDRLKQEKEMFDQQIESLKETADAELQEKLKGVQAASRAEHERLEEELTHRLEESENRLQEEIRVREVELAQAKKDLEETKTAEKELQARLDRRCPEKCVTM